MKTKYEIRVMELETEGLSTSDAQGAADVEFAQAHALQMLDALEMLHTMMLGEELTLSEVAYFKIVSDAIKKARGEK